MYTVHKNNPFPLEIRGDIYGAFYEEKIGNQYFQYIVIYPESFSYERFISLLNEGVNINLLHPSIPKLGYIPRENTYWLYRLMSFRVEDTYMDNQTSFSDHRENYTEFVFDDINEVLKFCQEQYAIGPAEFKKSWETNYPQW